MSMHHETIALTEQQDGWVKRQIESGHFGHDGESKPLPSRRLAVSG